MSDIEDAKLLDQCRNIRIATPDSIQPHGAILAIAKTTHTIDYLSANIADFLPQASVAWLGKTAAECGLDMLPKTSGRIDLTVQYQLHINCIELSQHYLYELERSVLEQDSLMTVLGESLQELLAAQDSKALHKEAMKHLQQITGFGHIMVYRFDEDWHGVVIDELIQEHDIALYGSYLHLHFPESDIPAQARALYQKQWLRMIADVSAEPSLLLSHADEPLDLSQSALRSVAQSHVQYLKNMAVAASLSVSILVNGKLWGLLAAHHADAKPLSQARRKAAEELAKLYSALLELNIKKAHQAWLEQNKDLLNWPIEAAKQGTSPLISIEKNLAALVSAFDCVGAIAWEQGVVAQHGSVPTMSVLEKVAHQLLEREFKDNYLAITQLSQLFASPPQTDFAGMLALSAPKEDGRLIILFRKEEPKEVVWSGDPRASAIKSVNGVLSPRHSFEAWRQTVTGQSRQWTEREMVLASYLANNLILAQATLNTLQNAQKNAKLNMLNMLLHDLGNAVSGISGIVTQLRHIHNNRQAEQNLTRVVTLIETHQAKFDAALGAGKGTALKHLLAEIVQNMSTTQAQTQELALSIESGVTHARELLDLQKSYAHSTSLYKRECHIAELLADATNLLRTTINARGKVTWQLSNNLPAMNVDRSKMMQVIINLLKNSCEAWDQTQHTEANLNIQLVTASDDEVVTLLVIDNGIGFDADIADSLFSVNFSTKERSSGLGLANCKRLADSCRVNLSLHSDGLHQGAVATLSFPKELWA